MSVTPASAADKNGTDSIAVNPATNGNIDKSRTRFEYLLNSGQPARDSIFVINTGTSDQEVTLYARDAFAGAKGEFLIQDQKVKPSDVGSWVTFENKLGEYKFTLKPHGFVTVPFDVHTPSNATPGDHVGAIVASAVSKGSTLNIVRRVAVRLYARLSGDMVAHLKVLNLKVTQTANPFNPFDSSQTVTYTLANDGNIELSADLTAQASGPFGAKIGFPQSLRVTNLLPGSERKIRQVIKSLPQLVISGTTVIVTGLSANAKDNFQAPKTRSDFSSTLVPSGWLFYIALALGVAVLWRTISRRRRPKSKIEQNREEAS
jgi:dihydroorotate dehydrogenase (fumarate)